MDKLPTSTGDRGISEPSTVWHGGSCFGMSYRCYPRPSIMGTSEVHELQQVQVCVFERCRKRALAGDYRSFRVKVTSIHWLFSKVPFSRIFLKLGIGKGWWITIDLLIFQSWKKLTFQLLVVTCFVGVAWWLDARFHSTLKSWFWLPSLKTIIFLPENWWWESMAFPLIKHVTFSGSTFVNFRGSTVVFFGCNISQSPRVPPKTCHWVTLA